MRKDEKRGLKVLRPGLLAISLCAGATCVAQELAYDEQAEIDGNGSIFVSSDAGKLIWMGNTKRCAEAREAEDRQTVGCLVMQSPEVGTTQPQLRLDIYLRGGQKTIIEPGGPILEWHFWENGREMALFFGEEPRKGTHVLYDAATGGVVEKVAEPPEGSQLPQWAKGAGQIQDESVPENDALKEERTKWVEKVLRQIGKIQPGMTRKDILKLFTTEGGISSRLQRTYVFVECPVIKVDVKFKAANDESNILREEPEDVIETISRPYLGWSVMD
jgi:hypothetical protein